MVEQALAARRRPVRRQRLRPLAAAARQRDAGPHLAAHRPQHGRQIDLPAPERADRDPGADGQLRAGPARAASASSTGCSRASAPPTISRAAARPSWSRWWRPRRSSTRPASARLVILDEIGRGTATFDGLSIAWATIEHLHEDEPLPRAVRDALPRADRARGQAAAAVQRHRAGEGMAGRGRVPARGGAGRRRPQLRHPGGEARGPAGGVIERAKVVLAKLEAEDRASPRGFEDLPLFAADRRSRAPSRRAIEALGDSHRGACGAQSRRDVAARGAGGALCAEGQGAATKDRSPDAASDARPQWSLAAATTPR